MTLDLIPRKQIFGNPDQANVQLSPDGSKLSFLAPLNGVLNLWVGPRENPDQVKPVTQDTDRGIQIYFWAYTNEHLLYMQDTGGDENYRLYVIHLPTGDIKCLTPFDGVFARPEVLSPKFPTEIILMLNKRDPQLHDVYRANINTGELFMLEENPGFNGYSIDDDYHVRLATQMTPDGGAQLLTRTATGWEPWDTIPAEDALTTWINSFNKPADKVYTVDSRGRNTSALCEVDIQTKEKIILAENLLADVADVIVHPTKKTVQAVSFIYDRKTWQILDPEIQVDIQTLNELSGGEIQIVNRTLDDRYWIVLFHGDDHPVRYYIYDRQARKAQFLFSSRKELEKFPLAKMHSVVLPARDGMKLVAYYTLPPGSDSDGDGIPDQPLPLVFTPHGGPWGRDFWGFNDWHQWLANRGYAALMVNFRASTGLGKDLTNAGDKGWDKIIEDQVDTIQWTVNHGIADPNRIAIMGGSFGGYSTLAGITFYPGKFACAVDLFGPVNLITLLESIPPYWKPQVDLFITRVGDFRTEEGRALLKKHSPLTYVDRIVTPLLIGQGVNDARVKQAESDQIVQAMKAQNIPVTYLLYPDEGHGFARPENNLSFYAISEAFLAKYLGCRYEGIGNDLKGSSLQVEEGAEDVPGLKDALDG